MSGADKLFQQAQEIMRLNRHMSLTLDPLFADLNFAFGEWRKKKDDQFWRRTLIRCLLAVTEALLWNMKNIVPKVAAVSSIQLTVDELATVNEVRVVMNAGKAENRKKFLPFRDNLKATFALFAKVHRASYSMDMGKDFDAMCNTYELRSRLMHPKKPFDPEVNDNAIRESQRGVAWLTKEFDALMSVCIAAVGTQPSS
jgi:hypothetical protein